MEDRDDYTTVSEAELQKLKKVLEDRNDYTTLSDAKLRKLKKIMENLDDFTPMTDAELQQLNKKKISPKALTRIIICAIIMLPITIAILFIIESPSAIGWYGYGGMCANGFFIWLPLIFWWGKFVFGGTLWDPDIQVKRIHPDGREEHGIQHGKRTGPIAGFLQGLGLFIALRIVFELIKYFIFS